MEKKGQTRLTFSIKTSQSEQIRPIQMESEQILEHDIYMNQYSSLLFTTYGRIEMQKCSSEVTYLHWDNRSHEIRIYGKKQDRQHATSIMNQIVDFLKHLQIDTKIELNNKGAEYVKKKY
jgi:hypothetical protein